MLTKVITGVVVVAIFVPYRMSSFGEDASFMQDFAVAVVAFAIGGGIGYLIEGNKKKDEKEDLKEDVQENKKNDPDLLDN